MASTTHTVASYPPPPPGYTRADSSGSYPYAALQPSPQPHHIYDASQSINSTPTETPPPSRGKMSYNLHSYAPSHAPPFQHSASSSFADQNSRIPQHQYPPGHIPSIFTAVYSGVSVYEMEVNEIAVMRRRTDSWLNATQILKVAGVEKGKRTKVLEKEILSGEHEKVQGGYGRYQGTWINYHRGREFCRQYGVEDLLRPLLEHDMGQDGITQAGQGGGTPTKEQAMAAQRKNRMKPDTRNQNSSPKGTFFKNISTSAVNAVAAMNNARLESPVPRPGSVQKKPAFGRTLSHPMNGVNESMYPGSSQRSMQSMRLENNNPGVNGHLDAPFGSQASQTFYNNSSQHIDPNLETQEPPRKKAKPSHERSFSHFSNGDYDMSMRESTPTEANESFLYQQKSIHESTFNATMPRVQPLPQPQTKPEFDKQRLLLSLFTDTFRADYSDHICITSLHDEDLDIPIDETAHTALHWAATLGKTPIVQALIKRGASIYRVNGGGETALIRASLTTNNFEQGSFPELLDLLGPTIEMPDGRGRTVLHHIAISSAIKGRSPACRYYLECLLEYVVRNGSAASSQQDHQNASFHARPKPIGLARFMGEIVNAQDRSGDTALNIAARISSKSIIQQLLEVGANPAIPNHGGLKPTDFGVGGSPEPAELGRSSQNLMSPSHEKTALAKVGESGKEIVHTMSSLLHDSENSFKAELQAKQSLIDAAHADLRKLTSLLAEDKRRLSEMQTNSDERKSLKQQIQNLCRSNDMIRQNIISQRRHSEGYINGGNFLPPTPNDLIRKDVVLGDADTGLQVDTSILEPISTSLSQGPHTNSAVLSPEAKKYIQDLPEVHILNARVGVYRANNELLQKTQLELEGSSVQLEKKLRKIVSVCTTKKESDVDEALGQLVVAIESEREEVDGTRIREFLRRVGASGGGEDSAEGEAVGMVGVGR
ncbi:transcriptional regulator swi6 [Agyrium rufum]|nr:transcriptional regulator swi6 [Agyrium rufum]